MFIDNKKAWSTLQQVITLWQMPNDSKIQTILRSVQTGKLIYDFLFTPPSPPVLLEKTGYSFCYQYLTDFIYQTITSFCKDKEIIFEININNNCFTIEKYILPSNVFVCFVKAKNEDDEKLMSGVWIHKKNLDSFDKVFSEMFWEGYGNKVVFEAKKVGWSYELQVIPLQININDFVGIFDENNILEMWNDFTRCNFRRSILLIGEPGTGKTTLAYRLVGKKECKMMQISVSTIYKTSNPAGLNAIVKLINPDILLMNDIHLMQEDTVEEMLHIMEFFNDSLSTNTLIMATSNSLDELDKALVRPGRFDEVLFLDLPLKKQREDIISYYLDKESCLLNNNLFEIIVNETEGFPPAYLKEIIKCIKVFFMNKKNNISDEQFFKGLQVYILDKINTKKRVLGIENIKDNDSDEDNVEKTVSYPVYKKNKPSYGKERPPRSKKISRI